MGQLSSKLDALAYLFAPLLLEGHPHVRSTIQHHGWTTNPWTCGTHVRISTCQVPSVAH